MLFVDGTPNLVGFTRDLLSDPSTAPRPLFSTQNIKDFLNIAYVELRDKARFVGDGHLVKVSYANAVAGTADYAFPSDMVKLRSVELELDGGNLSSLAPSAARIVVLTPADYTSAWQAYQLENVTEPTFACIKDRTIAILSPPDTSGTSSIRYVYEGAAALLSNDSDEPAISRGYHDLICRKAALDLLASKHQENVILAQRTAMREAEFLRAVTREHADPDGQFIVAGLDDQTAWIGKGGFVDWNDA